MYLSAILQINGVEEKCRVEHKIKEIYGVLTTYKNSGDVIWKFFGTKSEAGCINGSTSHREEYSENET